MHNPEIAQEANALPPRRLTLEEFGAAFPPVFFLYELAHGEGGHIPGDTTTPPAPDAIPIGPVDC